MPGRMAGRAGLAAFALVLGSTAVAFADDRPATEGIYVSRAQLDILVAKPSNGLVNAPVPTGSDATVLVVRREGDGAVEVHARLHDELIVREGRASLVVGGKVDGGRDTAPGERRGGEIRGGHVYQLSPGDVVWIPAGSPHQMRVPKGASISYLAIKFEVRP